MVRSGISLTQPVKKSDNSSWVIAEVTPQASVEITGLTPLTKYWFRVAAAVTINGTGEYCVPIM